MKIWIDADACPVAIRETIIRAAQRTETFATFVANQYINLPRSKFVSMMQVAQGFDVADNEIVKRISSNDLVITQDIPLASEVIEKGATALSPRGELFTADNIKPRLSMRDFMETLRSSGIQTGGPAPLSQSDKQAFANRLDQWLQVKRSRIRK